MNDIIENEFTQSILEETQDKEYQEPEEEYCPTCHNVGSLPVDQYGFKTRPCPNCSDTGVVPDALDKGNVIDCPTCLMVACWECRGYEELMKDCPTCEGKGYITNDYHDTERFT